MNCFRLLLVVAAGLATAAAADSGAADRKALLDHLDQSASGFTRSISGLTAEQWSYKPGEGWSIAECAEHIVLTEALLSQMTKDKILTGSPSPERIAERKVQDDKVIKMITDRSFKAKAPEQLKPSGQFTEPAAAVKRFEEGRKPTLALIDSSKDLRAFAAPHPMLKELDAHQWLLYLSGHTMRHTAQIEEVKASPGYPKSK